jgi:protein TonB
MTKERAVSLGASIAVNLAMIVAFASIANINGEKIKEGASLVVVGLGGAQSEAEAAEMRPAASLPAPPPPPAQPVPRSMTPEVAEKEPDRQQLALLEPLEQSAERASAPAAQPPSENRPSPEQLREAAEHQRRAEEAAKARAEQAENEARAAASARAAAASGSRGSGGYGAVILQHLQRFKRANSVGAGAALVRITIDGGGSLQDSAIVRSSGVPGFDREALQTVRRASPFPKPPGGEGRTINFAFTGR